MRTFHLGFWFFFGNTCALQATSFDQQVENLLGPIVNKFSQMVFYPLAITPETKIPIVILWLIFAAIFFTFYFRFINLWGIKYAFAYLSGKHDDKKGEGEVSHFQALATALSGTVGVGNIGAVAIAVSFGGPGAVFWLIVAGFLGMTTKFVECTLGVMYRNVNNDGQVLGGPMCYLRKGLREQGMKKTGEFLSYFYALGIVIGCLGIGNMFQANQAYVQFSVITNLKTLPAIGESWFFGTILMLAVGLVILGGIKSIAKVTEKIVPLMAITYVSMALLLISFHYEFIVPSAKLIVSQAFSPSGVSGGVIAVIMWGFRRALLSNEAGIGSAAIAHSAVKTDQPFSEGFVALLEPFIDTVVICTITGLVVVITSQAYPNIFEGIEPGVAMTSRAFEQQLWWSKYPLAFVILLFAYSTIISWSYYGLKGFQHLFGDGPLPTNIFKGLYCVCVIIGCALPIKPIIDFGDAAIFLICIPNILGLFLLCKSLRKKLYVELESIDAQLFPEKNKKDFYGLGSTSVEKN